VGTLEERNNRASGGKEKSTSMIKQVLSELCINGFWFIL
jgi:hypothetical protein